MSENEDNLEKEIELKETLELVVEQISDLCADKNKETVNKYIGEIDVGLDGFKQVQTWGLKKRLAPKNVIDPPAAKKNATGALVTDKHELETLYLETYQSRLSPNPISKDLDELKNLKEYLFSIRKRLAETEISEDWSIKDLEKVLKSLKNNKARDAYGHTYEIYKYAGKDLKYSMLRIFNMIKKNKSNI